MKRRIRKWHKWVGIIIAIPLLMLCSSGIILNHRSLFSDVNISRAILPSDYQYKNWNNGLMKGTIPMDSTHLLIYGKAGVWKTNILTHETVDYNQGFPKGVDHRAISRIIRGKNGTLYAAAQFALYQRENGKEWAKVDANSDNVIKKNIPFDDSRLTDISQKGDSIILSTKSHLYVYIPPKNSVEEITIPMVKGEKPNVSLFRTIWTLHSGEIFGIVGKICVDAISLVLLFLIISGLIVWIWPKRIRRNKKQTTTQGKKQLLQQLKWNSLWHDKLGRWTIILTLFVAITGWFLRPPLLILISRGSITLPYSPKNPWKEKLRAIQYDQQMNDWLLYTSDGFYSLKTLKSTPEPLAIQPPVGIMGLTVFCREFPPAHFSEKERWEQQVWMVGSFSGLYAWHRPSGEVFDVIKGTSVTPNTPTMPFGNLSVSGYSNDMIPSIVCAYDKGGVGSATNVERIPQPENLKNLPISLWNLALEIHTGRIFTFMGIFSTLLYIFIIGLLIVIVLITGWLLRKKQHKHIQ